MEKMSGSTSVAVSCGGDVYTAPFTAVQWQELEHQALIYKYLVAGVPVPSDLVMPIRRSLDALSAKFLHHPTLGYCSYYGKKFDPEPGRCRRTDGKKWRCSKDAYHESKYCERHMHRGRNRSRKPVESQATAQSVSTAISHVSSIDSGKRSYQNASSERCSSQSLYSISNSDSFDVGSNASKLQLDTGSFAINRKDPRYSQALTFNIDGQNHPSGENITGLDMDSNVDNSWRLMSSQVPTNSLLKPQSDSYLQTNYLQLNMANTFETMMDATSMSKERQKHCYLGGENSSTEQVKHEHSSLRPLFVEWQKAKESWSNINATTQLSISMDPDFNASDACPSNGGPSYMSLDSRDA